MPKGLRASAFFVEIKRCKLNTVKRRKNFWDRLVDGVLFSTGLWFDFRSKQVYETKMLLNGEGFVLKS
ncbi:hypothetical protein [Paenibacillus chibensis]|uniref:hypothetical protein n=1 Tax=Paenibacillus chibensis TaxID=59846 RepID=UPI000FDC2458|nr:hypothetical protein [Paenibacillus chibensis]MEC0372249.1 hypothetical protein [Paenibacillus chibensis]